MPKIAAPFRLCMSVYVCVCVFTKDLGGKGEQQKGGRSRREGGVGDLSRCNALVVS